MRNCFCFFWRTLIYRLKSVLKIWENNPCISLLLTFFFFFFFCCAVLCLVTQSCLTLCDPMESSPPDSYLHGILQARILEWVGMPFSRGSSQSGTESRAPILQMDSLPSEPPGKPIDFFYQGVYSFGGVWGREWAERKKEAL